MTTLAAHEPAAASIPHLSHLQLLEAESIQIFREVASEFQKPVMLYSIGKDSSVMLRLAQKAFFPGPIPFPLLHIDTGYKFLEMITFRDNLAKELGLDLRVWRNEQALADGANPVALGTQRCCGLLKTTALLDGLRELRLRRSLRRSTPRRRKIPRQGAHLLLPRQGRPVGPQEPAPRALEPLQRPHLPRRKHPRLPALQLDRARHLALHPARRHPHRPPLLRQRPPHDSPRRLASSPSSNPS